ncbi:helix-turn-helix domain-containing protein [Chitinophaga sp. sic0106]|uniref:helix-turn-helix domain-containing protein n=1 Tax=Chitinophaga sp. sic0106 TaxID=2854785 RepID=UPI001C45A236|nr:helix-turn-helix domain-containing protein [Chitinophaga sp. sic0106]MBV7533046.1 helix-turn-helix domain-containing protein [Chitinophaga sp. sic0106]
MKHIDIPDNIGPVELLRIKMLLKEKDILTSEEAAIYLGISKATLFKLTSKQVLPFSKPNGKLIYFKRTSLDDWMMSKEGSSELQQNVLANHYLLNSLNKL